MRTLDMNATRWAHYTATLTWRCGYLDESSWKAALRAASLGVQQELVFETLCELIKKAGDTPKAEKIQSQIERACAFVLAGGIERNEANVTLHIPRAPTLPTVRASFEPGTLHKIGARVDVANVFEFVQRKSAMTPAYLRSGDYLDAMYRVGERALIFTKMETQGQMLWQKGVTPAHELPCGGTDGVWFLANPVDGEWHPNPRQGGKLSRRSEESVSAFRYAVLESDEANSADWVKLLAQLPLPIESICESGGRSIHTLFRVDAQTKQEWDCIIKPAKPLLTRLGADPGALSAVRLSRLPQAYRGDRQQRLLYANPGATATPIKDLLDRPLWCDWRDWVRLMWVQGFVPTTEDARACAQYLTPFAAEANVAECLAWLSGFTNGKAVGV